MESIEELLSGNFIYETVDALEELKTEKISKLNLIKDILKKQRIDIGKVKAKKEFYIVAIEKGISQYDNLIGSIQNEYAMLINKFNDNISSKMKEIDKLSKEIKIIEDIIKAYRDKTINR